MTRHKSAKHARHEGSVSSASTKHDDNDNIFNINDYITLVNQSCKSLEKDICYAESVRESFRVYVFKIAGEEDKERFSQVKKLYSFVRKGNVEKFYAKYFASVVSIASEYLPFSYLSSPQFCLPPGWLTRLHPVRRIPIVK